MITNPLQTNASGLGRRTSQAPERVDFSKIYTTAQIPNLIEVQRESYNRFLQMDLIPEEREKIGLQSVFDSIFPVSDFRETATLEYVEYQIGNWQCKCGNLEGLEHLRSNCKNCNAKIKVDPFNPAEVLCNSCGTFNAVRPNLCNNCGEPVGLKHKHDQQDCQERGMSFSVPLKVKIRLTVYDKDAETGTSTIRDIKEEDVFFGEIPLMTENGTFIINGTERVIVSQLHRSPGVFFKGDHDEYLAKIIPYRGSWVEFEYDQKGLLHARLGKRKILATIFLRALGLWLNPQIDMKTVSDPILEEVVKNAEYTNEDVLRLFYTVDRAVVDNGKLYVEVKPEGNTHLTNMRADEDIKEKKEDVVRIGKKITKMALGELRRAGIQRVQINASELEGAFSLSDVVNTETGEVIIESNTEIGAGNLQQIVEEGVEGFDVFFPKTDVIGEVISNTLRKDAITKPVDALLEIYRKMRPGDPPTVPTAYHLLEGMFFDARRFDLSRVGRLKFNIKMGRPEKDRIDSPLLDAGDFIEVVNYLLRMKRDSEHYYQDDIDHLGNRRVRAVGELLENQFRIGLERMERAIKEKMSIQQDMFTTM
ncbi:MAG: DNA-directed RNA polymerase subunit beta, partial [Blastocatellia bacterium]|nr:DNA-directed RNA polymerase subunit beta [Blastocatellia bacterium]